MKKSINITIPILAGLILAGALEGAVRVKDVGKIAGSDALRLIGYGLVVGLEGTGDSPKSLYTNQALANMLEKFGIAVDGSRVRASNVAAVIVNADVPPFSRAGARFDVIVSSLGDAKSLQGGVLLQTTLNDISGAVWGVAAGPLSIGGFNVEAGNVSVRQNYASVGRVPNGGELVFDLGTKSADTTQLTYTLNHGDYITARRLSKAVNNHFGELVAMPLDPVSVRITVPAGYASLDSIVLFIAELEAVTFEPDIAARVVINERTGTIVIGENVNLSTVAVSHGALSITIKATPMVSQPQPFSRGETRTEQYQEVTVEQRGTGVVVIPGTTTVGDIAAALNRLGVTPRDIIAIFQALKQSGALQAELVII
ncbi:MAG: flagellar basal body P-ring protein FlgI [Calditrichaeota bacterium]|nr:flagellar basal body P-ring protein FlgI [Calditrichota bacterium]